MSTCVAGWPYSSAYSPTCVSMPASILPFYYSLPHSLGCTSLTLPISLSLPLPLCLCLCLSTLSPLCRSTLCLSILCLSLSLCPPPPQSSTATVQAPARMGTARGTTKRNGSGKTESGVKEVFAPKIRKPRHAQRSKGGGATHMMCISPLHTPHATRHTPPCCVVHARRPFLSYQCDRVLSVSVRNRAFKQDHEGIRRGEIPFAHLLVVSAPLSPLSP